MTADESGFPAMTGAQGNARERVRKFVRGRMAEMTPPLTIMGLAERADVSRDTASDFVNGRTWPQPATVASVERALGLDAGTLDLVLAGQDVSTPVGRSAETDAITDESRELVVTFRTDALSDLSPTQREEVEAAAREAALRRIREIRGQ